MRKYLPRGPALDAGQRAAWDRPPVSAAKYTGAAKVAFPVLPLQIWGVSYDLDLVLESGHQRYDMHEYARIQTPDGPVWMAKDALSADKTQSIVADLGDIHDWVPEVPVQRKSYPLAVEDRSTDDWLDIRIRYANLEGEPVEITYEGPAPKSVQRRRSGNTMGHSANAAMAVLDIPYRDFARRASVTIGGEPVKIRRLLGLVKLQVALVQTQGGFAVAEFRLSQAEGGFSAAMKFQGQTVERSWTVEDTGDAVVARQADGFRTLGYTFVKSDDALELSTMEVAQYGFDEPIVRIALTPTLPDLRRTFEGRHTSRFVVDVNDQRGQAVGRVEAFWDGDEAGLLMLPEDPVWVRDRPMSTTVRFPERDVAQVSIERIAIGP